MSPSFPVACLLLALATPCFAQQRVILSGVFEGDGASLTEFVTARERLALPARERWGGNLARLGPELLRALPSFRAQVLFERRGDELVPVRLHSPLPYEGWVQVHAGDRVSVNGFDAAPTGPLWQHLWADELAGRELRVVGLRGAARGGARQLHVVKVEATVRAATTTLRRADGAGQPWLLTYGRRVWLQHGGAATDRDGVPLLTVSDEDTPADAASARPWRARVTDLRIGQRPAARASVGLAGSVPR